MPIFLAGPGIRGHQPISIQPAACARCRQPNAWPSAGELKRGARNRCFFVYIIRVLWMAFSQLQETGLIGIAQARGTFGCLVGRRHAPNHQQ